jgi:centromeric protein E
MVRSCADDISDKLLQYPSTTPELYEVKVAPLVEKAMNGFNSTVFAYVSRSCYLISPDLTFRNHRYGQTGSGKSFTMVRHLDELTLALRHWLIESIDRNAIRARYHTLRGRRRLRCNQCCMPFHIGSSGMLTSGMLTNTQEPDRAYLLRVSYIEIYNETLRDLLNFKKGPLKDDEKPVIHTTKVRRYIFWR